MIYSKSTCIFFIDILFKFNTAEYRHGLINKNRAKIISRYLKNEFILDFLTANLLYFTKINSQKAILVNFYLPLVYRKTIDALGKIIYSINFNDV